MLRLLIVSCLLVTSSMPVFAAEENVRNFAISEEDLNNATQAPPQEQGLYPTPRTAQAKSIDIPGSKGKLTSNAWRETGDGTISGNTKQWDYQVSAVYSGSYSVEYIRTTWQGSASLRNSASINLGIDASGASAGTSSSWQSVNTVSKYWENSNGAKEASYRSNMVVTPKADYRADTIGLVNTAKVKLKVDSKPYQINASV